MPTSDGPALRVSVVRTGGTAVVTLRGELDLATGDALRARLAEVTGTAPPPARLVLDVAGLAFVDAAGIAVLLGAQRALARTGGTVSLRSPSRLVRRVVRVLQLGHLLPVEG